MNNFGMIYRYECKKLMNKKIVRISFLLSLTIILFSFFAPFLGDYCVGGEFVDTNYNMFRTERSYSLALSGRPIGQELLEETIAAYRKIPYVQGMNYTLTEEYQTWARPYSAIFNFIRKTTDLSTSDLIHSWTPDEADLYARRQLRLASDWKELRLSEAETAFWKGQEAQIQKPVIYQAHDGYDMILSSFQTVGIVLLMILSIGLSGIFSEEHSRKTDQIILCSPLGKTNLYRAKLAAGISFAAAGTLLLFVFTFVPALCLYGTEGSHSAFQLIYASSSAPLTCIQAVLIAYANMLITAVLISVFVMVLSELLRSNLAALAVSAVLLILPMVISVPAQYRVLAQVWDWLPWCFLSPWNVFGSYAISILDHHLAPWQAVPMLYIAAAVLIAAAGKPLFEGFEVSGR